MGSGPRGHRGRKNSPAPRVAAARYGRRNRESRTMLRKLLAWVLDADTPIGSLLPGWNAVVAARHLEATERYLLGACGQPRVELSAAQRARRR